MDAHRSGAGGTEGSAQALERLGGALRRLRTFLPRGTDTSEGVALARWVCDAALAAGQPSAAP